MNVAYLFHEDDRIVVPFYNYDPLLFKILVQSKTGFWDYAQNQFIIEKKQLDNGTLRRFFPGRPCVEFNQGLDNPPKVSGFFNRPWASVNSVSGIQNVIPCPPPAQTGKHRALNSAGMPSRASGAGTPSLPAISDTTCLVESLSLPEMFSPSWAAKLESELHSRKYSPRTIRSYLHYNKYFCRRIQKTPEAVTAGDIKNYLAYLDKTLDLSASSMNLAISALKFFYKYVMKKDIAREQHRPRHDKKLPAVFSGPEIRNLLDCEKNPKHRLLLMLAYSSGLRVSEVVALKKEHIDFHRKLILIHTGKGRKDRYTLLSDRAAEFILQYCGLHEIDGWLFPGASIGHHLSVRSAQTIFAKALTKARIAKPASIHSLRHTFATHLLENGTDIRYIQELLGHTTLRTTQRYTQVTRRTVLKIRSPLDNFPAPD
ncbi:MAG: tyrosine-type recombinase/integrase [Treponema sp.]|jgi:site-specific recombinase XerD|nr:tyrosine-type recombinase/integrase [Treponema sp.]